MGNHEGNVINYLNIYTSPIEEVFFIPKRLNLVGKQFDELTVIEMLYNYQNKHRTYCRCLGIDNNEYIVRADSLQSGVTHTIHGAMSGGKAHDITGQRFGRLIAIRPTSMRASNGGIRWECLCDCGIIVYPTMNNLKRGHTTSCGCAKQDYIESTKLDIIGKRFGKLVVLEEVFPPNRKRRMVKCLCDCGNICICAVTDLTIGHTASCGCGSKSKGELYISEILDQLNIPFIQQKRFDKCKNKRKLPFDFYLPILNICIEYDGYQHFHPVKYWGGEEMFKVRQQNDQIKDDFCRRNNIKLIRISYKMKKKEIYNILNNLLSPATIIV